MSSREVERSSQNLAGASVAQLWIQETEGMVRRAEPVALGFPVADGDLADGVPTLEDADGEQLPCQFEVLSRWPSGQPRWVTVTTILDLKPAEQKELRVISSGTPQADASSRPLASQQPRLRTDGRLLAAEELPFTIRAGCSVDLDLRDRHGKSCSVSHVQTSKTPGTVCNRWELAGTVRRQDLQFTARFTAFHHTPLLKLDFTLHNPGRAEHRGGFWDQGDRGSQLLQSVSLDVDVDLPAKRWIKWSETVGDDSHESEATQWSLRQESSGGENWNSRVHRDRHGSVPWTQQGYVLNCGGEKRPGQRASPVVCLSGEQGGIAAAVEDFWQKFPTAIEINGDQLCIQLLPDIPGHLHELQPGEEFSQTVWLRFDETAADPSQLAWVFRPLVESPENEALASTGGLEWTTRSVGEKLPEEDELTRSMLGGLQSFFAKREAIDEYGWRNYGDAWADHEEAYAEDPSPVISHYNNQYDLLHGFLRMFLATGDQRWWQLARPLAQHVIDIDIYHTQRDRAVYNGGLFWHTSHYLDAGLGTHRSFSREMLGRKYAVNGGGPGNEHNYSSGLLLYYHLTGDLRARRAVLSLADWVIAMDDGNRHLLAPLSFPGERTGNASSTASPDYHGPGRGSGNSINALIDGWQVTRAPHYLEKCEELIRRVVHPEDNPDELQLLEAETRWSYTVCLQALLRYDDIVGEVNADLAQYVRAVLVRYGRWMLDNERLYLDHPEQLEFPTETWAAQDLRKGVTLKMIARYLRGDERHKMAARGDELFHSAWQQLMQYSTRYYTRPCAIVLQQLPIAWYAKQRLAEANSVDASFAGGRKAWPKRSPFRTQKQQIKDRLRSPFGIITSLCLMLRPQAWARVVPKTYWANRLRGWIRRMK